MLSEKEKREMLEDAHSDKIKNSFQEAERKYIEWIKKHPRYNSMDNYIMFLDSIQKVNGPFPIERKVPPNLNKYKL